MKAPRRTAKNFDFQKRDEVIANFFTLTPKPTAHDIARLAYTLRDIGLYSPRTYLGDILRAISRRLITLHVQAQCSHKFIDSNRCLKCGWVPPGHPPGKSLTQVFTQDEVQRLQAGILSVANECNCRAEHGVYGPAHLLAIETLLRKLVAP